MSRIIADRLDTQVTITVDRHPTFRTWGIKMDFPDKWTEDIAKAVAVRTQQSHPCLASALPIIHLGKPTTIFWQMGSEAEADAAYNAIANDNRTEY